MREGWEIRKLGDIVFYPSKRIPCVSINADCYVGVDNLIKDRGGKVRATVVPNAGNTIEYKQGDILIGNIRPYLKKIWLADNNGGASGDVIIIRPNSRDVLFPNYLYWSLSTDAFFEYDILHSKGAKMPRGSKDDILNYEIPVPPIPEQEKIVAELDCLTDIIEKKKQQLEELDKLAQSIFYDMFGSSEYQKGQLISLCADKDDIKCGPFGTQLSKSEFLKDGVPVWGIPQVNSNFAIPPTDFVSEEKALALQSFSIVGGDIVMSRKGNIGQSAIYPTSFESGILHSDVLRIRVKRELANPLYLVYQFHQSAEIKHQFKIIGYGAIMPGLNVSKLKNVIVDIPPITLQNEFAQKIEAIEKQKELIKKSIQETETLFNSRMDYWFN